MNPLAVTALLLLGGRLSRDVIWSPNVPLALAWARKVHKPVLVAGLGMQSGAGFLTDPMFDDILNSFVPVEATSYFDVVNVTKGLPHEGNPQVVILAPDGLLLKRLGGPFLRPRDLALAKQQIDWLQTKGPEILKRAALPNADGDVLASAATIYAMRADDDTSIRYLARASEKHASAGKMLDAWEALGDDARVSGMEDSLPRSVRYYRAALGCSPDPVAESRIRVRLASSLWRMGDTPGATEQTRRVVGDSRFPADERERARHLQDRISGAS